MDHPGWCNYLRGLVGVPGLPKSLCRALLVAQEIAASDLAGWERGFWSDGVWSPGGRPVEDWALRVCGVQCHRPLVLKTLRTVRIKGLE